jgi:hypothetical protein
MLFLPQAQHKKSISTAIPNASQAMLNLLVTKLFLIFLFYKEHAQK